MKKTLLLKYHAVFPDLIQYTEQITLWFLKMFPSKLPIRGILSKITNLYILLYLCMEMTEVLNMFVYIYGYTLIYVWDSER